MFGKVALAVVVKSAAFYLVLLFHVVPLLVTFLSFILPSVVSLIFAFVRSSCVNKEANLSFFFLFFIQYQRNDVIAVVE